MEDMEDKKRQKAKDRVAMGFKKTNKKTKIAVMITFGIFGLYIVFRLWLNFHFLTTDDLWVGIEPSFLNMHTAHDEDSKVHASVVVQKSLACTAVCSYSFLDISRNQTLGNGSFTVKGAENEYTKEYAVNPDRVGSGQNLYRFDVQCVNIPSWHCLTNENVRQRTLFVAVTYTLSHEVEEIKQNVQSNLSYLIATAQETDILLQSINNTISLQNGIVPLSNEEIIFMGLQKEHAHAILTLRRTAKVWDDEQYVSLNEKMWQLADDVAAANKKTLLLEEQLQQTLARYKSTISKIGKIEQKIQDKRVEVSSRSKVAVEIIAIWNATQAIKESVRSREFSTIDGLSESVSKIEDQYSDFAELMSEKALEGFYLFTVESDVLCEIKGICESLDVYNILERYENASLSLLTACEGLSSLKQSIEKQSWNESFTFGNEAVKNSASSIVNISRVSAGADLELMIEKYKGTKKEQASVILKNLTSRFESAPPNDAFPYNDSQIKDALFVNVSSISAEYIDSYCSNNSVAVPFPSFSILELMPKDQLKQFNSSFSIMLDENYPLCCVNNECNRCCDSQCNVPPQYPVLFIHGHSLNSQNSPDYSLDIFNALEQDMENAEYVNVGTLSFADIDETSEPNAWAMINKPIMAKGSYYLINYYNLGKYTVATQKSENIETYAIRLKELIDEMKQRAGKDKVIIITHSMGGLVARSYLSIFGHKDIAKLIMVATPNQGVEGSVQKYCTLLGESKECEDMAAESIFIKKLNDPNRKPSVPITNIIGTGCKMGDEQGDGVVSVGHAYLEYANNIYVNGSCSGFSKPLHTQILNTRAYPEVSKIIKKELNELTG